jgi:hypothetical protein
MKLLNITGLLIINEGGRRFTLTLQPWCWLRVWVFGRVWEFGKFNALAAAFHISEEAYQASFHALLRVRLTGQTRVGWAEDEK